MLTFFLLCLLNLLACEADLGGMESRISSTPCLSPLTLSSPVCKGKTESKRGTLKTLHKNKRTIVPRRSWVSSYVWGQESTDCPKKKKSGYFLFTEAPKGYKVTICKYPVLCSLESQATVACSKQRYHEIPFILCRRYKVSF